MLQSSDNSHYFIDPSDQVSVLRNLACSSLAHHGFTYSMVCAHRGPDPLFLALIRPYEKGNHLDPIREVLTLAEPLGADRLAFCSTGRAWSMHDPVPPVCDEGDLRQRVVIVCQSDTSDEYGKVETVHSYLWPLEECLAGNKPSVLPGGKGPLHTLMAEAALAGEAVRKHNPIPPWEDDTCLRNGAALILELEQHGHSIVSLGPKLEHTMGLWLDRLCTKPAA